MIASATFMLAAALSTGNLPLVAGHLVTGPDSRIELTNTSMQPVTAWALAISQETDGHLRRTIETIDAYLSEVTRGLPGSSARLDRFMPGESRQFSIDPVPPGTTVAVVAVVLDDRTGLGDPEILAGIFRKRAAERGELRRLTDTFDQVLAARQGAAALEELRDRLGPSSAPDLSMAHRLASQAAEAALQRAAASGPEQGEQLMRSYAALVRREYEAALKHAPEEPNAP